MPEREHVARVLRDAGIRAASDLYARGERSGALDLCEKLFHRDRADEQAHRLILEARAGEGDLSGMIREHERFRQAMHEELGAEPGEETTRLSAACGLISWTHKPVDWSLTMTASKRRVAEDCGRTGNGDMDEEQQRWGAKRLLIREREKLAAEMRALSFGELVDALERGDERRQRAAAIALGDLKGERAFPILVRTLETTNSGDVRDGAAIGLGELEDSRAIETLLGWIRPLPLLRMP